MKCSITKVIMTLNHSIAGRDDLYTVNTSMVFINEANSWGLEFYIHNATDELIKTDSYPANAGFCLLYTSDAADES